MTALPSDPLPDAAAAHVAAWAASGAMALTGRADGPPLGPPAALVPGLRDLAARWATADGRPVPFDALALLGERAALAGLARRGTTSCGGGTRLLPAADGWLAVSLARPDDWAAVPAWLGAAPTWDAVAGAVAGRSVQQAIEQGLLLGLPIAALPTAPAPLPAASVDETRTADAEAKPLTSTLVLDLTALWAGPLCGALLADAGARVVKLESTGRPDGARQGPTAFFDLCNAGKESVAVDLRTAPGRAQLAALIERADIVLEAARPRALEQLGIDRAASMAGTGPQVWLSITGHGRAGPGRERIAFGDDAAVAGGLVVWDEDVPCFCADAVADPVTGLTAAVAVAEAIRRGGRWTVDVSMAAVAASLAGATLPAPVALEAAAPRARPHRGVARALGADTASILGELDRSR